MPRGDRTGPAGLGPVTGRRAGYCAGYGMPGYTNNAVGSGRGFGSGYGAFPFVPPAELKSGADVERWNLERQAKALGEELKAIQGRLDMLGNVEESAEDTQK